MRTGEDTCPYDEKVDGNEKSIVAKSGKMRYNISVCVIYTFLEG